MEFSRVGLHYAVICLMFPNSAIADSAVMSHHDNVTISEYGKGLCQDDYFALFVQIKGLKYPSFRDIQPLEKEIISVVYKSCPHAHQLRVYLNTSHGVRQIADVDPNWHLRDLSGNLTVETRLYQSFGLEFSPSFNRFDHALQMLKDPLSDKDKENLSRDIDFSKAYNAINLDPRYSMLQFKYASLVNNNLIDDAPSLPVTKVSAVTAEAAIMILAAAYFFATNVENRNYLWSQYSSHLSHSGLTAVAQSTFTVGAEARKIGITDQTVQQGNQSSDDPCAREEPKALAEARFFVGQDPPAKMIIPIEKIKDPAYEGKGWEKWIYDYRRNNVSIQIHYMYQPSTKLSDQYKIAFCKAL